MPRIRCHYVDCVFLDQGYCAAAAAELDPEEGCLTYSPAGEISPEEAWEDNEDMEKEWEEAGFGSADPEDDLWLEVDDDEEEPISDDLDLEED
ncbi:MAG: hypothetical protein DWG76_05550 [Chloroflexi bacterium]|nr:hypothetical protein [Chloroflexota bacterium]MQC26895.1 hypothetical protein [Chloroflexota bacterium]